MENARLHGPPWQSRLIPYEQEILGLRRRRPPMPFDQITARLATKYGVKVQPGFDAQQGLGIVDSGRYRVWAMSKNTFTPKVNSASEFLEISNDFTDPKEILRETISLLYNSV